jgi:hypothetical protein
MSLQQGLPAGSYAGRLVHGDVSSCGMDSDAECPPKLNHHVAPTPARFFEWLSISHPHNNVHNMRLCRLVADAKVLQPAALAEADAMSRVSEECTHQLSR